MLIMKILLLATWKNSSIFVRLLNTEGKSLGTNACHTAHSCWCRPEDVKEALQSSQAAPFLLLMQRCLAEFAIRRPDTAQRRPGMGSRISCPSVLHQGMRQRCVRPTQHLIAGCQFCCTHLRMRPGIMWPIMPRL